MNDSDEANAVVRGKKKNKQTNQQKNQPKASFPNPNVRITL